MTVLDASAVLALLGGETGKDVVGAELASGDCVMSAANWSEVWQKARHRELPFAALRALAEIVDIVPVDRSQAELAAALWSASPHLSLADRLCLALAREQGRVAMTADHAWARTDTVEVTLIR